MTAPDTWSRNSPSSRLGGRDVDQLQRAFREVVRHVRRICGDVNVFFGDDLSVRGRGEPSGVNGRRRFSVNTRENAGYCSVGSSARASARSSVSALAIFAGAGVAAGTVKPANTSLPKISGTPGESKCPDGGPGAAGQQPVGLQLLLAALRQERQQLRGDQRRSRQTYTLTSADVGNSIRFRVVAKNADGSTTATSVPTAVITAAPPPVPPRGNGCPPGGNPDQVANITPPARLLVDTLQSDPAGRRRQHRDPGRPVPRHVVVRRSGPGRARLRDGDAVQPVLDPARGADRRRRLGRAAVPAAVRLPGQLTSSSCWRCSSRPEVGREPARRVSRRAGSSRCAST